ncbi:MAG: tetratricopeptide repeat protein [Burkholderiaceae bacterium]
MNPTPKVRTVQRARTTLVQTPDGSTQEAVDLLSKAYALDRSGREKEAIPLYKAALRGRLKKEERINAMICLASSHRVVGNLNASLRWLAACARAAPRDAVVRLFQALAHLERGDAVRGLGVLADALLDGVDMRRVTAYRPALRRYFRRAVRATRR